MFALRKDRAGQLGLGVQLAGHLGFRLVRAAVPGRGTPPDAAQVRPGGRATIEEALRYQDLGVNYVGELERSLAKLTMLCD